MTGAETGMRQLAEFVRTQRINFVLDPSQEQWPQEYSQVFSMVQDIGYINFEQYKREASLSVEQKPWMTRLVSSAETLVTKAIRRVDEEQTEDGWRLDIEHVIFAPLKEGTSCVNCGGRMWQAHLEPPEGDFQPVARSLRKRQERRVPCQCHANGQGLLQRAYPNDNFSFRANMMMLPDPQILKTLPIKFPDLVYGLRKWTDFDETCSNISSAVETNPYASAKEPLLFPFLVLEAKREKESPGFSRIGYQAAIPIQRLLQLQQRLRSAALTTGNAILHPLVWFLATRGDDFRLYGAYIKDVDGQENYEIHCLTDGRMTKRDGALQILLVIHYIAEWARGYYSLMVRNQLKLLADPQADNHSLYGGSDATTLREYRKRSQLIENIGSESGGRQADSELPSLEDGPFGWLRNISSIEHRFSGLYLDSSNIDDFIQYLQEYDERTQPMYRVVRVRNDGNGEYHDPPKDRKSIRDQLSQLISSLLRPKKQADYRCLISEHALNRLEELWTGQTRGNMPSTQESLKLWASITLTFYISHQWQLVRELSCVAVSDQALSRIEKFSNSKPRSVLPPTEVATEPLETLAMRLKAVSAEDNLAAAISRFTVSLPLALLASGTSSNSDAPSTTNPMAETDKTFEKTGDWVTHEIILYAKRLHLHHGMERSKTYLRVSSESEIQQQHNSPDPWPLRVPNLIQKQDGVVIVYGEPANMTDFKEMFPHESVPNQCMFVKLQPGQQIAKSLKDSVLSWNIYRTVRRESKDLRPPRAQDSDRISKLEYMKFDLPKYLNMVKWISELDRDIWTDIPIPSQINLEEWSNQERNRSDNLNTLIRSVWRHQVEKRINARKEKHQVQDAQKGKFRILAEDFSHSPSAAPPTAGERSTHENNIGQRIQAVEEPRIKRPRV